MATGRIGTTPVLTTRWSKAPNAGTTSLSGLDDNSVSLVYSVGYEAVYQNGVLLSRGNDYTATNGTTITLTTATVAGDIIEVFANQTIPLTDTYSQTVSDGRFIKNTLTTTTGDIIYASAANTPARLGIGNTGQVLTVSGGVPAWGSANAVGCTAFTSTAQNTTQNVYTVINLNSEAFDTDNLHSTSSNTSRLTIPTGKGGYWLINAFAVIDASGNDVFLQVFKNGSVITGYGQWDNRVAASNYGGAGYVIAGGSQTYPLVAGDYIEIAVRTAKATGANCLNMTFSAMYLGA